MRALNDELVTSHGLPQTQIFEKNCLKALHDSRGLTKKDTKSQFLKKNWLSWNELWKFLFIAAWG